MSTIDIINISNELDALKLSDFSKESNQDKYIDTLLNMEKQIEMIEYTKILTLLKQKSSIVEHMQTLIKTIGYTHFSNFLKSFLISVSNLQKDTKKTFKIQNKIFNNIFSNKKIKNALIKDCKILLRDTKHDHNLLTSNSNKIIKTFKHLISEIEYDFELIYDLKQNMIHYYNHYKKNIPPNSNKSSKAIQLEHHLELEKSKLSNQFKFITSSINDIIHTLDHIGRAANLNLKQNEHIDLNSFIKNTIKDDFIYEKSLSINYKNPAKTLTKELKIIKRILPKKEIEGILPLLIEIINFIKHEYHSHCDSKYHGLEHMSQVTITAMRIFECALRHKHYKLTSRDLFKLAIAAIFHDVGFFAEKYSSLTPGSMSSMFQKTHESKSMELFKQYIIHFKFKIKEVLSLNELAWKKFIISCNNIISGTQLFLPANNEKKDFFLLKAIRAADLLEIATETYTNNLISLYREHKIADPTAPWPGNLNSFIKDTPRFIEKFNASNERVGSMLLYLKEYNYEYNVKALLNNLEHFSQKEKDIAARIKTLQALDIKINIKVKNISKVI